MHIRDAVHAMLHIDMLRIDVLSAAAAAAAVIKHVNKMLWCHHRTAHSVN